VYHAELQYINAEEAAPQADSIRIINNCFDAIKDQNNQNVLQ
jgi:hypothetical protein